MREGLHIKPARLGLASCYQWHFYMNLVLADIFIYAIHVSNVVSI